MKATGRGSNGFPRLIQFRSIGIIPKVVGNSDDVFGASIEFSHGTNRDSGSRKQILFARERRKTSQFVIQNPPSVTLKGSPHQHEK